MEVQEGLADAGGGCPLPKALSARTKDCPKDLISAWTLRGDSTRGKIRCSKVSEASGVLVCGLSLIKVTRSEGTEQNGPCKIVVKSKINFPAFQNSVTHRVAMGCFNKIWDIFLLKTQGFNTCLWHCR